MMTKSWNRTNHVYRFSDGYTAQYNNRKNFISLCLHERNCGVTAERHFYVTFPQKGLYKSADGTVKWLAEHSSPQWQRSSNNDSPQSHDWSTDNIKMCDFEHTPSLLYKQSSSFTYRHWNPKTPCNSPSQFKQIKDKDIFKSGKYKKKNTSTMDYDSITAFVTCDDCKWYAGCVLSTEEETQWRYCPTP
jgi:hypothetical protein